METGTGTMGREGDDDGRLSRTRRSAKHCEIRASSTRFPRRPTGDYRSPTVHAVGSNGVFQFVLTSRLVTVRAYRVGPKKATAV